MDTLAGIAERVRICQLCDLSKSRKNAVPGEGNPHAKLLIVGEGPGKNEDLLGRPFIGMAGKFLDKNLEAAGIKRDEVFITNAVKCRPPNNRKPVETELNACKPYLIGQAGLIRPKLILVMGTSAATTLGLKYKHLSEVRGKVHSVSLGDKNFNCLVAFHPSFPMRFPSKRETFLSDLKEACKLIES